MHMSHAARTTDVHKDASHFVSLLRLVCDSRYNPFEALTLATVIFLLTRPYHSPSSLFKLFESYL